MIGDHGLLYRDRTLKYTGFFIVTISLLSMAEGLTFHMRHKNDDVFRFISISTTELLR